MKFSERIGIVPPRTALQVRSMDNLLRTALWNALTLTYFSRTYSTRGVAYADDDLAKFVELLWSNYLGRPLDTIPNRWNQVLTELRSYFFSAEWYSVYEFIEFCSLHFPDEELNKQFRDISNYFMEREKGGCRFVGNEIAEITSPEEIGAIEESLTL